MKMKIKSFFNNFKGSFRIVIMHPDTYEEKGAFATSKLKVAVLVIVAAFLLVSGTAALIVLTPIRELIPGYTDVTLSQRIYEMERRTDSLEVVLRQKDLYINNLRCIISGEQLPDDSLRAVTLINKGVKTTTTVSDIKSKNDSLFRLQFETEVKNDILLALDTLEK